MDSFYLTIRKEIFRLPTRDYSVYWHILILHVEICAHSKARKGISLHCVWLVLLALQHTEAVAFWGCKSMELSHSQIKRFEKIFYASSLLVAQRMELTVVQCIVTELCKIM